MVTRLNLNFRPQDFNPIRHDFRRDPGVPKPIGHIVLGEFKHEGPVWVLELTHAQTQVLVGLIGTGAGLAPLLIPISGPLAAAVAVELGKAGSYIEAINKLGGENGVCINGVIGTSGVIVTPRIGGLFEQLVQAARIAVSGRTIIEFVLFAATKVPALGAALNVPVAAGILAAVSSGTPLGWAIAAGVGLAVHIFENPPDPDQHGGVHADRDEAREWESFLLASIGNGGEVAILSWQGFFSARDGGGAGVYANRPHVQEWEKWTLIHNGDGTISLRTFNGHFLCAEGGGGQECWANRTAIGPWEKFYPVFQQDGKVAFKTAERGKFVSVQRDL